MNTMADMELVWEFANDGVWTRYDDDVQEKIRQAKEAKLPQVEVSPCHMLDFAQCRQFHKHDSSKWRGVQMVQVPHERLALLDVSSRASPGRFTPDHCDQGLFETTMQACSNAWRCFAGEALVQKAEELQVPGPLTLLQQESVLQDDKAMPVAEAFGSDLEELEWEFKADGPGWQRYPAQVNASINKAYRAGQPQVEVPTNHVIHFAQGRQMNKSDISRWRAVRNQVRGRPGH